MTWNRTGIPSPTAWLWWTAVILLAAGVGISRLILLFDTGPEAAGGALSRLVLAVFISLAGICVISATAGWWIRR